jgi:hypothetical protein
MSDSTPPQTHPSYGMVGFSRVHVGGKGVNLFGSSVRQSEVIALKVSTGQVRRDLARNWYTDVESIVEVYMSPNQFAELITHLNSGAGIPCTITRNGNKSVPPCPEFDERQQFEEEFKDDVKKIMSRTASLIADVEERFKKKSIGVGDKEAILQELALIRQDIEQNLPFVQTQFNEAIDKTATEAKATVEAFVENKIREAGLEHLTARPMIDLPPAKQIE